MGEHSAPNLKRHLPQVVLATLLVAVCPIAIVSPFAVAASPGLAILLSVLAVLFSLGASSLGAVWWKKRPGSQDLLFSELLVWGWLRRCWTERRLSRARGLLAGGPQALDRERQVELFVGLARAMEARDAYTHGHTRRVTLYSSAIAKRMGLSGEMIAKVRTAAALHDVGKVNVPRAVLNNPGPLNAEELALIRRHPGDGADMVAKLGDDEITAMVRHHHERVDGRGYPDGIVGLDIPLGARIIAVADTFDAITSNRAYGNANSHKKALGILAREAGLQLDPVAVRAFSSYYSGRRGLAAWALLTTASQRLIGLLGVELNSVGGASLTRGFSTVALMGALGASLGTSILAGGSGAHASRGRLLAATAGPPGPGAQASPLGHRTAAVAHAQRSGRLSGRRPGSRVGTGEPRLRPRHPSASGQIIPRSPTAGRPGSGEPSRTSPLPTASRRGGGGAENGAPPPPPPRGVPILPNRLPSVPVPSPSLPPVRVRPVPVPSVAVPTVPVRPVSVPSAAVATVQASPVPTSLP
ncbi:MAG: hypothetical protein NVS2B6_06420 [Thermoleophilaceae bacterium]